MKKILFIMNDLYLGGAQKALISLLETIDYSKYEVDLFLISHKGIFMSQIPDHINLLSEPIYYKYFDMPFKCAIADLLRKKEISVLLNRLGFAYLSKIEKSSTIREQKAWKYLSNIMGRLTKEYDVAIGFLEKMPIYFCIDKVKAKQKIGWIHTDYDRLNLNKKIERKYIDKLDYIITVSNECEQNIVKNFPEKENKIKVINNIVSSKLIIKLSKEKVKDFNFDINFNQIVSVGRIEPEKGFDIALEACELLIKKGIKINWTIIGDGTEKIKLEKLANEKCISEYFKIIGAKYNPYNYMNKADIYVQPSRFEGKSIAIDEAKILHKPIIVTDFTTAKGQINNNITGIISKMTAIDLCENIEKLINDRELQNKLINNLKNENLANEYEINKFYSLIN